MFRTDELPPSAVAMTVVRGLATLTTLRADGSPHVVPVGYTFEPATSLVRVIASDGTQKVVNAERGLRGVVCQVDGGNWISFEGPTTVSRDPDDVADACRRYGERYQEPRPNPQRVVIVIHVDRVLGRFPSD